MAKPTNVITFDPATVTQEREENTFRGGYTSSREGTPYIQKYIAASGLDAKDPLVQWRATRARSWTDGLYVADPQFNARQRTQLYRTYVRNGIQTNYDKIIRENNLPTHVKVGDKVERLQDAIRDPGVWGALRTKFWREASDSRDPQIWKKFNALESLEFAVSTEHMARRLVGQGKPVPYMTHIESFQEKLTAKFKDVKGQAYKKWEEATSENGVLTNAFRSAGDKLQDAKQGIEKGWKDLDVGNRLTGWFDYARQKIHEATAPPKEPVPIKVEPERHSRLNFAPGMQFNT